MKKLLALISDSYHEFKHISTITTCAMFGAMSIVLNQLRHHPCNSQFKDRLWRPAQRCWWIICSARSSAACSAARMDVIKFMLKPDGGFMPGFTFNAMLAAFIYGLFLYKKPLSLKRMLAAKLVVAVLCNILLGTLWLSMINGKGYLALLPARAVKNLIQWPVDSLIFVLVAKTLEQAGVFRLVRRQHQS